MITYSSIEARSNFSEVLDIARRQPVGISKHKRIVSVLIAKEDYDRYKRLENNGIGGCALEEERWMNYKTIPAQDATDEINSRIERLEQKFLDNGL